MNKFICYAPKSLDDAGLYSFWTRFCLACDRKSLKGRWKDHYIRVIGMCDKNDDLEREGFGKPLLISFFVEKHEEDSKKIIHTTLVWIEKMGGNQIILSIPAHQENIVKHNRGLAMEEIFTSITEQLAHFNPKL